MDRIFAVHRQSVPALLLTGMLAACSGGGGGAQSPPPDTNQTPDTPPYNSFAQQPADPADIDQRAAAFVDDEYNGMNFLGMVNASYAYARGATGKGVTVGILDSGVYEQHFEFQSGFFGDKVDYAGNDYALFGLPRSNDAIGHGTMVAGVIAANRDGVVPGEFNYHGIAYDADILAWEIPLGSDDGPYEPVDLGLFGLNDDLYFAERIQAMFDRVDILNMSFGFSGVITGFHAGDIQTSLPNTLEALRQSNKAAGDRGIAVFAAGNAFDDIGLDGRHVDAGSPEFFAGLPYLFPELEDHVLAVVAVDNSGQIAFYSNRCGVAADFCLAAPGGGGTSETDVVFGPIAPPTGEDPNLEYYGGAIGTSFAAPLVSGGLALLKQMFPTVGNDELVNRLLTTANRNGIYADSTIYGQGLLDLEAATRPVGGTSLATGASLDGQAISSGVSQVTTLGTALGDSLNIGLGRQLAAVFDSMGFPFYRPASNLVRAELSLPIEKNLQHDSIERENGLQVSTGYSVSAVDEQSQWWGQVDDGVQPDYLALYYRDEQGERFTSIRANPGWFFGIYANGTFRPGDTLDDSLFAAPWLRFARKGISAGAGMALSQDFFGISLNSTLRYGFFEGSASWDQNQPASDNRARGALLEYQLSVQRADISLQSGMLVESSSFLGTRSSGALGSTGDSRTWFGGINSRLQLTERWTGMLAWYAGFTRPDISDGLIRIDETLLSTSFAAGLTGDSIWQERDSLGVYLSQPLRIETGSADIRLPVGRTIQREVLYDDLVVNLEPSGREQRLELVYSFNIGRVRAATRAYLVHNPWHSKLVGDRASVSFGVSVPIDF